MGQGLFLADNVFNGGFPGSQYPDHVITAEEEATDHEWWRVSNGRRSPTDYWTSTTANSENSDTWIKVKCNRARGANMVVIDAGHNLAGETVKIEGSDDNFTTIDTIHNDVMPSVSSPGNIDNTLGIVTEEGAWLRRFPLRAHLYYRAFIPAMGANLTPEIVGLWLGLAWETEVAWPPVAENQMELAGQESLSPDLWRGRTGLAIGRTDVMTLKLPSFFAYDQARFHIEGLFAANHPTWILYNTDQADRAVLAGPRLGRIGFRFGSPTDWGYQQIGLDWVEHEPLRI